MEIWFWLESEFEHRMDWPRIGSRIDFCKMILSHFQYVLKLHFWVYLSMFGQKNSRGSFSTAIQSYMSHFFSLKEWYLSFCGMLATNGAKEGCCAAEACALWKCSKCKKFPFWKCNKIGFGSSKNQTFLTKSDIFE